MSNSTSTPEAATSTPESATSTPAEPPAPQIAQEKILISEIQLAGATADDEFIELYNPNSAAVSLYGWSIQYRGASSEKFYKKNFEDTAQIPGYGFFLVSHKNYFASGMADMAHSSFALSAAGGTVVLVRGQEFLATGAEPEISDKVAYYKGTPPSGASLFPETKEINITNIISGGSMERKSNASSTAATMAAGGINETQGNAEDTDNNGNDFIIQQKSNPQSFSSVPEDPSKQDYDEIIICATPQYGTHQKTDGAVDRLVPGLQDFPIVPKNQTVTLVGNTTYYVDDLNGAYVPQNSRLIVEAGAVIKFNKWRRDNGSSPYMPLRLLVAGSLEVNGTKENPVIFTTFRDDEHGLAIETSTTTPAPGDWGSITIESQNNDTVRIAGAKFFYAGGSQGDGNSAGGAIYINQSQADIQISDVEISHSQSGIYSKPKANIQPQISGSRIAYNRVWGFSAAKDTGIKITGTEFICNGLSRASGTTGGVNIEGKPDNIIIEGNNFWANTNAGLSYYTYKNETLSAPNNFWGHSSGPQHTTNLGGSGDIIFGSVNLSPWSKIKF
jgi:hypothetical protein